MNRVDKSIFIFGLYSLVMGIALLFMPNFILPLVGIPTTNEAWVYLLGFVLICSSYYYLRSSLNSNRAFAEYTTQTRFLAPLVVSFLIITKKADWHFLAFGIVDSLGGLWTWIELKKQKR
jgi:uncharacterized membrane protein